MKLSEIMWVQAGFGNSRRVMPFMVKKDVIFSMADDRLFQVDDKKSMFDNIYEICQKEYGYSTVVMGENTKNIPRLDTSKGVPTILNFKLPGLFTSMHKKEYVAEKDMTVKPSEVKALSRFLTKQLAKSLENANKAEREL